MRRFATQIIGLALLFCIAAPSASAWQHPMGFYTELVERNARGTFTNQMPVAKLSEDFVPQLRRYGERSHSYTIQRRLERVMELYTCPADKLVRVRTYFNQERLVCNDK